MATAILEFDLANPTSGLRDYLDEVSLASDDEREEKEGNGDGVTLITLHSCKGLEFPHVYLVGMEDGLLPHERSKDEGTIEEERRLFYVGITRAMKTLTLSHARSRMKFGEPSLRQPSPFLKELPEELVEHCAGIDRNAPAPPEMAKAFFAQFK
jgi:superfamily I DNA/RNA helicase